MPGCEFAVGGKVVLVEGSGVVVELVDAAVPDFPKCPPQAVRLNARTATMMRRIGNLSIASSLFQTESS